MQRFIGVARRTEPAEASGANGIYEPKVRALDLVYAGCMAQHGYLQQKPQ
jgi:hypothetical protein